MFLIIPRTSTSNVLKTFLNIIMVVSNGIFNSNKPTGSRYYSFWYHCQQERNIIIMKKDSRTKLYMHNTIGDVALTNISRETDCLYDFIQ